MIRNIVERTVGDGLLYIEAAGASSDTKPTSGIVTGILFMESDTGNVYVYDEDGANWTKIGG